MLRAKFNELKARKERVDQITELLLTLKTEEDMREALEGDDGEALPKAVESSHTPGGGGEMSELVAGDDEDLPPNIEELQMKLR